MTRVITHMTMSLDGYVADPHDDPGELFDWYQAGDVTVKHANPDLGDFRVDESSASVLRDLLSSPGALICGRHLFDISDGWNDAHPTGARVVVVTHLPPPDATKRWPKTTFVSSVKDAVVTAKKLARDADVTIASPTIIQQALDLGFVDEVAISLVPVLFGEGKSYFGSLRAGHLVLEDPEVVLGHRALHLRYKVGKTMGGQQVISEGKVTESRRSHAMQGGGLLGFPDAARDSTVWAVVAAEEPWPSPRSRAARHG